MSLKDFLRAGHTPTLFCAFLYFDISFMVWVLLGALANAIVRSQLVNGLEISSNCTSTQFLARVACKPRCTSSLGKQRAKHPF